MHLVSREINKFIQNLHKNMLIFYVKQNNIYVIDNSIYLLKGLLNFKYLFKSERKIIFIDKNYFNYVLDKLRDNSISYVVIEINNGYNNILQHNATNNKYNFFYKKGKRIVKNERRIEKLLSQLRYKDVGTLLKVIKVIDSGCH